ncbi:MAG: type ISP restriction/modification enzyme [Patescibacteria group bacterium]
MNEEFTKNYLNRIIETHKSGQATEHSYRPALQELFEKVTALRVHNEPKRSEYGAPDFVFVNKKIIVAYAEAKDINVSLNEIEKSEQMIRYYGYTNIILTNSLEFRFYKSGQKFYEPIKIAELKSGEIIAAEENFKLLDDSIKDFISEANEPIKSGAVLAKVMAGKARRIRDNIKKFLKEGNTPANESLLSVYNVIKRLLLADLDHDKFADMYAQTVVYGLFVARYNDDTPDTFSRQEARDLVPRSNPFLRKFFDHIAGEDFDKRIEFIVSELCEEFIHADVKAIVHDYYKVEKDDSRDPIIHFYEDFLQEYDAAERKKMGVFYTPLPVVRFIVRAIDDVLKKEFGLKGLADTSKVEIQGVSQGKKYKQSVHKVQILDPATGTGTFLNEVIEYIEKSFTGQKGRWVSYAQEDLLPRLHGFEIMMASYTIAHLKLSTTLKEGGVDMGKGRLGVYLTNSLEKAESYDNTLFAGLGLGQAITDESVAANKVKNDLPIMVILGNPPYNVSSQNKGEWIGELIKDYKKDLGERKINLDDDYIKFIRFSQYLIDKNGEGIIGMITNNSYIDGITHRQMRKTLLESFDCIYVLDLHGNAKKKETAPDGGVDQNVFSIMQGVSITIFVKKAGKKKALGAVYHAELFGKQKDKYEALNNATIEKIKWKKLDYKEPYYFFVPKDFSSQEDYDNGFLITDLFDIYSAGIKTKVDDIATDFSRNILFDRINKILTNKPSLKELITQYNLGTNTTWEYEKASRAIFDESKIRNFSYRPFDYRFVYFDHDFLSRSRKKVMEHIVKDNLALSFIHQGRNKGVEALITKEVTCEDFITNHTFTAPLYLYDGKIKMGASGTIEAERVPNLNLLIARKIAECVEMVYYPVAEYETIKPDKRLTPENILDYIYAVLYSPSYREKYKEFLKIDFPRVPYPKDEKQFFALARLGEELRHLHLLESPKVDNPITTYLIAGDNLVEKVNYQDGKVYINKTQYFVGVPEEVWNFYIGGYQPAQKWLKDRKGRNLASEDIEHYQKMIVSIFETIRIMKEIDQIVEKNSK